MLHSNVFTTGKFPALNSISLKFDNLTWDQDPARREYANGLLTIIGFHPRPEYHTCDFLLERLVGVASSLETLLITVDIEHELGLDWMRYVNCLTTLRQFRNLKHLSVPQDFLLGRDYGKKQKPEYRHCVPNSMPSVLSQSLETLQIALPTMEIRTWIQELLDHRLSFPAMRKLGFSCVTGKGASFPEIYFDDDNMWVRLAAAGIEREVEYRVQDVEDAWCSMDAARIVNKVVR
jgi:hypothetical protein